MAIDVNKTYSVPGWALALLVTAAGGGLVWGGFNLDTAQAKSVEHPERFSFELDGTSDTCIASMLNRQYCPLIEAEHPATVGGCTAQVAMNRFVGNFDVRQQTRTVQVDPECEEDCETTQELFRMGGAQIMLPASLTVDLP